MSTQFKKGDRVRVTLEGTVVNIVPFDDKVELRIEDEHGVVRYIEPSTAQVEKIEPEVETFGPGTAVRLKGGKATSAHWLIGPKGFTIVHTGRFVPYDASSMSLDDWTSDYFERVPVG